jgi:hypothetical protein
MKYLCLDQDYCGYVKKIDKSTPVTQEMLDAPFLQCEQCSSSMVLVQDDFYLHNQFQVEKNEIFKVIPFSKYFRSK